MHDGGPIFNVDMNSDELSALKDLDFSEDYPIGSMVEPYDIQREKDLIDQIEREEEEEERINTPAIYRKKIKSSKNFDQFADFVEMFGMTRFDASVLWKRYRVSQYKKIKWA